MRVTMAKPDDHDTQRRSEFWQALGAEFSMLQSARGSTISESSSRASLYMVLGRRQPDQSKPRPSRAGKRRLPGPRLLSR